MLAQIESFLILIYLLISIHISGVTKLISGLVFTVEGHRGSAFPVASYFLFFFYLYFTSKFE